MSHSASRILFASSHCLVDPSSGAAIATLDDFSCSRGPTFNAALFVLIQIFQTESSRIDEWLPGEPEEMLAAFERVLADFRPTSC
jgi:hypothetical protein